MADWLQTALVALIPAVLPSAAALVLGIKSWARDDLRQIEKQLNDLSKDVAEIKGGMPHMRDRLATLEAGSSGRRRR